MACCIKIVIFAVDLLLPHVDGENAVLVYPHIVDPDILYRLAHGRFICGEQTAADPVVRTCYKAVVPAVWLFANSGDFSFFARILCYRSPIVQFILKKFIFDRSPVTFSVKMAVKSGD